jgi:hypothetical protein
MSAPNPYAPPQAALKDAQPAAGSAVKAITLGLVADIGGTFAATIVFVVVYGIVLGASGASPEEIAAAAEISSTDSWLFYVTALLGLGFSVLGGFVCARVARRDEMKLGAVLAAISAVLGFALAGDTYQLGTLLSLSLASIGAVMAGARLGYAKNRGTK